MSKRLYLDLETYSEIPIRNGVHAYVEQAEILLFAYAFDDKPVQVWDVTSDQHMPFELQMALEDSAVEVWAHNSHFDRTILEHTMPELTPHVERWRDTMIQALSHSLPGALGALCDVLKINQDKAKDKAGTQLIQLFCKPRPKNSKIRRATRETHQAEWERFVEYAALDIYAMREIHRVVPKWNYGERDVALWHLDQQINDRGVCVDVQLAEAAVAAVDKEQKLLAERTQNLTDGEVNAATQRDAMLKHILVSYGVSLPDMQRSTLERRIADPDLPPQVKDLLSVRLQASTTSTSKYNALMRCVSSDGRLRGTLQFRGASRTGRWAGRLFQPQNLPRAALSQAQIDLAIDALKADCADLLFDNVMEVTSSTIRGCIKAPSGKKLVVSDLSNIEGRMLAWLASEKWKLQAFHDFDAGQGHDLYKLAYARAYNIDVESVTKDMRQIGKVMELACIAEGQLVLTNQGLIPIEKVGTHIKVWDGNSFVKHQGVIYKGEREVITYEGLTATPDHIVWTNHGQLKFGDAAQSGAHLIQSGNGRKAIRLGSDNQPSSRLHEATLANVLRSGPLRKLWAGPLVLLIESGKRAITGVPKLFPTPPSSGLVGSADHKHETALHQPEKRRLCKLRRAWNSVLLPFGFGSGYLDNSASRASPRKGFGQDRQQWTLCAGQSSLRNPPPEQFEPPEQQTNGKRLSMAEKLMSLFVLHRPPSTPRRAEPKRGDNPSQACSKRQTEKLEDNRASPTRVRVYDIVNCGPLNRFTVSDALVHNCGYGGGVAAFVTFALGYGLDLDELANAALPNTPRDVIRESKSWYDESVKRKQTYGLSERVFIACDSLKRLWRRAHPNTCDFWRDIETAVRKAIATPKTTFPCGYLKVRRDGAWLRILLPSGRALCYPQPRIDENITYAGINSYSRKWERLKTYSGKIVENITQASACDVLTDNMSTIENAGYDIVLTVHDEVITEAPDDEQFNAHELSALLSKTPTWASDIPLNAGGFEAYHYRKE